MVMKRFAFVMVGAFVVQAAVFSCHYRDLIALRSPARVLAASPVVFRKIAGQALRRARLTRPHLETLAETARLTGDLDTEITARQRLWEHSPSESHLGLSLAEALRRAKRFDEAEMVYRQLLGPSLSAGNR